jgi:formylglycine-generating enzyme required for sulfatase activity
MMKSYSVEVGTLMSTKRRSSLRNTLPAALLLNLVWLGAAAAADPLTQPASLESPYPAEMGTVIESELGPGDKKYAFNFTEYYGFSGQAGELVSVELLSNADVYVDVLTHKRNGGKLVKGNQDDRTYLPKITMTLPQDGDYVLRVMSIKPRTFRLALSSERRPLSGAGAQPTPATTGAPPGMKSGHAQPDLFAGQTMQGAITNSDARTAAAAPYDCFRLSTEPGSQWTIVMESTVVDAQLALGRGEECAGVAFDLSTDNRGQGRNARLSFNSGGGSYLIFAIANSEGRGPYTIRAELNPGTAARSLLSAGTPPIFIPDGSASTVVGQAGKAPAPGTTIQDCPTCPAMVVVPAGAFMMGSPATEAGRDANEGPRHRVVFAKPYAIGQHEVTFDQWNACVAEGGCTQKPFDQGWGEGKRPVINVSFNDVLRYVGWLSKKTGHKYFLPSEAEWEYAARAGSETPWNTGDGIITDDGNFLSQFKKTVPVSAYPPNAFGLYDMHGNVAEWVQDCLDTGYVGVPSDGSAATSSPCRRIVRGGAFDKEPVAIRSATRLEVAAKPYVNVGFRVTRALESESDNRKPGVTPNAN